MDKSMDGTIMTHNELLYAVGFHFAMQGPSIETQDRSFLGCDVSPCSPALDDQSILKASTASRSCRSAQWVFELCFARQIGAALSFPIKSSFPSVI